MPHFVGITFHLAQIFTIHKMCHLEMSLIFSEIHSHLDFIESEIHWMTAFVNV